jgi:hypothetical protein
VTELKCKQENCPPFETIMVQMAPGGNLKRRIHCRLADLTRDLTAACWAQGETEEGFMPPGVLGRGLHSSTSQLNLSRFWSLKPQPASTSQLNLKRFCRCDL